MKKSDVDSSNNLGYSVDTSSFIRVELFNDLKEKELEKLNYETERKS